MSDLADFCLHEAPKTEVGGVEFGAAGRPLVGGDNWDTVPREPDDGGPGGVAGCTVLLVNQPLALEVLQGARCTQPRLAVHHRLTLEEQYPVCRP